MIIAKRYTIEQIEGSDFLKIHNHDAPLCPKCGSLCSGYDTRSRRAVGDDARASIYRLRRVLCPVCNILHLELPDFLCPRKHYTAAVIDGVLSGSGENCPAENTTMWRWRRENYPPDSQCLSSENVVQSTHIDIEEASHEKEG